MLTRNRQPKVARTPALVAAIAFSLAIGCFAFAQTFAQKRAQKRAPVTGKSVSVEHDGKEREFRIYEYQSPVEAKEYPLVVLLHGGGGSSMQASRLGMSQLAEKHGFYAVYPNGIKKHWNDGRKSEYFEDQHVTNDDVGFIVSVINQVVQDYPIDDKKIFVTGISNGGLMTQRLAIEHSEIFAGAASIVATMAKPLSKTFGKNFAPETSVPMMFMNGTKDPLMLYDGGELLVNLMPRLIKRENLKSRGFTTGTDETIKLWASNNGLGEQEPTTTKLPDIDKEDGSHIEKVVWDNGKPGTAIVLYRVVGGGHCVPGPTHLIPERLVGKGNKDIDGLEHVWKFFETYGR